MSHPSSASRLLGIVTDLGGLHWSAWASVSGRSMADRAAFFCSWRSSLGFISAASLRISASALVVRRASSALAGFGLASRALRRGAVSRLIADGSIASVRPTIGRIHVVAEIGEELADRHRPDAVQTRTP